jgi:hypothetical protein
VSVIGLLQDVAQSSAVDMNGPARAAVAAGVAAAAFLGVGAAVMAVQDDGGSTPTTTTEVRPVASIETSTTEAPTTAAPVTEATTVPPVTVAPGFEDYTPGDDLPSPPPAPSPGDPTVSTVPGPYGPIYPDGYVDPDLPPSTVDTTPPAPRPVGN